MNDETALVVGVLPACHKVFRIAVQIVIRGLDCRLSVEFDIEFSYICTDSAYHTCNENLGEAVQLLGKVDHNSPLG